MSVGDPSTVQQPSVRLPPAGFAWDWGREGRYLTRGRGKAGRSIYGITPPSQEEKTAGWVGDKQKTAVLARGSRGTLTLSRRLAYCSGYVFGSSSLLRHERDYFIKGKVDIIRELQRNTVTILVGETGSGKTTREPSSHIPVHPSLIHTKRYPSTSLRQASRAGNALRSPNRGGLLLHLLLPASPRSREFLWVHPSDILFVLTSIAARTRRSNSLRMECWFGN